MATEWEQELDPAEELDFVMDFASSPPIGSPVLGVGEGIASFALAVTPEAAALGLEIMTGLGRDATEAGGQITLWLTVNVGFQANAAYDGAGTKLGIVCTIMTDSIPARKRERTYSVRVKQL